jgi:hypothetical protein
MIRVAAIIVLFFSVSCTSKAELNEETTKRLQKKALLAKTYCEQNNLNPKFCVLIDMKIHSGKKRFFLWDLKGDSVLKVGMCSHGTCGNLKEYDTSLSPQFSNTPESHCSSLGKYKIGKRGYSSFGININYKLHGLEKSNNNAYKRFIVFHSWEIADDEIYPQELTESWGCPAVSNNFMREMDVVLKNEEKPVLLWIYN